MATKMLTTEQCSVLHQHWAPSECCLCKAKAELAEHKAEVERLKAKVDYEQRQKEALCLELDSLNAAIKEGAEAEESILRDCGASGSTAPDEQQPCGECLRCLNGQLGEKDEQLAELRALLTELAEFRELLLEVDSMLKPVGSEDWWCPTCKELLPWNRVTYEECCDTCGTHLPSWPKDTDQLKAKIAAVLSVTTTDKLRAAATGEGKHVVCVHQFEANPGMYDSLHRYCTKCGIVEGAGKEEVKHE